MNRLRTIFAAFFTIGLTALYSQEVGSAAPSFAMYQYKGKQFSTDTVYAKKVVTFIFGSIT